MNNDYTVVIHFDSGETEDVEEWFTLNVAKKIAAKAFDARQSVVNSPVVAIEVVDFDRNTIQIARFDSE